MTSKKQPTKMSDETIGEKIREARKAAGLTQKQLAEISGVPQSHLSAYELDKVLPTLPSLRRIADALGRDVEVEFLRRRRKRP